jgi:YD repeat-containing protein
MTRSRDPAEQRFDTAACGWNLTCDSAGNRVTEEAGGTVTYSYYDVANQLTTQVCDSSRATYSYDANGNLHVANNMGDRTTHSWDVEDRVVEVRPPGGGTINEVVYFGDGKRYTYTDSEMVRTYLWDGENIARQTLRDYTYNPQRYGELILGLLRVRGKP